MSESRPSKMFSVLFICLLGLLVYSNSLWCPFEFDDFKFITGNMVLRSLHAIWAYYPSRFITFCSFALNFKLGEFNVIGYHLLNLAIHLGAAVLLWQLVMLTMQTPVMKKAAVPLHAPSVALLSGLIFVTHPLQTESVTYIWQRSTCLSALLCLASLCLYAKSRMSCESKHYYISALITTILAMFTKENAIVLPLLIFLYEYTFFDAKTPADIKRLWPFLASVVIIPFTFLVAPSAQTVNLHTLAKDPSFAHPLSYWLTQFRVLLTYIRLSFLPINQNIDYDYPVFHSLLQGPVLGSCIFLAAVGLWARRLHGKYPLISFTIFWFFLSLVPECFLLPQLDIIFEHRLYLALAGYSIFLAAGFLYLGKKAPRWAVIAVILLISANSILTFQRNYVWRSAISLWNDAVLKSPHKERTLLNRRYAYIRSGDATQAIGELSKTIQENPANAQAYASRGLVFAREKKLVSAIADYNKAIELDPKLVPAYFNRAFLYYEQGGYREALDDLNKAAQLAPDYAGIYVKRGNTYRLLGDPVDALADYNKAIALDPDQGEAFYNRALIEDAQGQILRAIADYVRAVREFPDYADAFLNLGVIYDKQGDTVEAMANYHRSIELAPENPKPYAFRGVLYAKQNKFKEALGDFDKAIALNPRYAEAYYDRGLCYLQANDQAHALSDLEKAAELGYAVNPGLFEQIKETLNHK